MNSIQPIKEGWRRPRIHNRATLAHPWHLTGAEWRVVEALCRGRSTPEMLDELGIAVGTLNAHLLSIYRKLRVYDRVGIIVTVLNDPDARQKCFPHLQITER